MQREDGAEEQPDHHQALILAGAGFLAAGLALELLGLFNPAGRALSGIALLILTLPVAKEAAEGIRRHPFNEYLLMSIAGVIAALIGVWPEGAAVMLVYNIAEHVEDYTVDRVRLLAEKTARLLPRRAIRLRQGAEEDIGVEAIAPGDILLVKPGWRVPVDASVVQGRSSVDQSAITGESISVDKGPGDLLLSGSLNQEGALEIRATKPFRESTVSRIVALVTEARERKANIERFITRFSRVYTPSMLAVAAAIAFVPPLALREPLGTWVYRALIALIIACPSALVISAPVITLLGLTRAMWSGALVKGGKYLEELARVRVVAFDKTGTLTYGRPHVAAVTAFDGFTAEEVLRVAASLETRSSHPIAAAIVAEAKSRGIEFQPALGGVEVSGLGVEAHSGPARVLVGRAAFLSARGVTLPEDVGSPPEAGTSVLVAIDGRVAGQILLEDRIRDEARGAVDELRRIGVQEVVMLTGDNAQTAARVATQIGAEGCEANLLPDQKVNAVQRLRARRGSVAMVGDGVNDAPVLAASSVGIAVGTAGNDVALEAADVALMSGDLRTVPYLIRLGRRVAVQLRASVAAALFVKVALIVVGALGWIPLWVAIVGDDGLTLVIVAAALPLLGFARKGAEGSRTQAPPRGPAGVRQ